MQHVRNTTMTILILLFSVLQVPLAHAVEPLGIGMESYAYPHPVHYLDLQMEGTPVRLAYMDVAADPAVQDPPAVVLLHGRNFFGAYWAETIDALRGAGYRVIVPDQIGFGKSSKPDVPHSLHAHAMNVRTLLDALKIDRAHVVGHSLGGMMAARFALMYPPSVRKLVLESPIGLEDYRLKVPYATREALTREHLESSTETFDRLFRAFVARWEPRFQTYSDVQAGWLLGAESQRIGRTAAHTWLMAYEQPVLYEFPRLSVPTLLIVGELDRAAIGRNRVSPEVRATLGQIPQLAKQAAAALPNGKLVVLPDVAHVPHLETPARFHREVLGFLGD